MQPEIGFNLPVPAGGWARIMATSAGTTNLDWAAALLGLPGPDPIGSCWRSQPRRRRCVDLLPAVTPRGGEGRVVGRPPGPA